MGGTGKGYMAKGRTVLFLFFSSAFCPADLRQAAAVLCRRVVEFLGEDFRIVALAGESAGVCDFQNGIFRGVQEVAADLQTVPVEEIYGGLLHIFLEKLAAFASGYAPRRGNTG